MFHGHVFLMFYICWFAMLRKSYQFFSNCDLLLKKNVQVGKENENAQLEKDVGKTKLTIRYLYHENTKT